MNKGTQSLILIFVLVSFFGCQKPLYKDSEFIMGTYVEVTSSDPRAKSIVFAEFKRLESIFNLFDEKSELSRLNAAGSLVVSSDLFNILKKTKQFYEASAGAFDVTIAPVSLIWKRAIKTREFPKDADIKNALSLVGFDYVYLDDSTLTVKLMKLGSQIDLGGIAKGYALDKAVEKLKEAHVLSALVNAGGNIYGLGNNNKKPWQIGIQNPRKENDVIEKIELNDEAVATSGDYEQFFIYQNRRYSHIIDPKTGQPADAGIISTTVIAPDAMTADALSTTLFILGKDSGAHLLALFPGVKARFISEDGKLHNF